MMPDITKKIITDIKENPEINQDILNYDIEKIFNDTLLLTNIDKEIENLFEYSQNESSTLLLYVSRDFKQGNLDDIIFTIESSKKKAISKIRSFFGGELINEIHVITIKNIFSDLVIERYNYKKLEKRLNDIILKSFILNEIQIRKEGYNDLSSYILGARISAIKSISSIKSLIDANVGITNNLLKYVQSLSPSLFNELMLNYFNIIELNGNYSKDIKLRIDKINILKKMIRDKVNDFYSVSNIEKLNKIYKKSEKKYDPDVLYNDIEGIKTDFKLMETSLSTLKANLISNMNFLNEFLGNEKEKEIINNIIEDCKKTIDHIDEVIENANKKYNLIF